MPDNEKEGKIDNLQFFKQLIQAYTIVFINILGLDR